MSKEAEKIPMEPGAGSRAGALVLFLALVLLFSLFRYLHVVAKLATEAPFIDLAHYYTSGAVVARGLNPFDAPAVAPAAAHYPPLSHVMMRPWLLMPFRTAAVAWLLASQACLIGTVWLCFRRFAPVSPIPVAATLFVGLNYQPLIESLALGRPDALLLFLVTLAWWGLRTGSSWTAAGAVALALHIKPQYGLLIPLLWAGGHLRVGTRALLLGALGVGVGLLVLGPGYHLAYLRYVFSLPDDLYAWASNLSPQGTFHRLLATVPHGPALAAVLTLGLDGFLLVLFARTLRPSVPADSPAADWAWGLMLVAVPLLSPLTEEPHLVVLLLPVTFLFLTEPPPGATGPDRILLVGSVLLLASRYSLEQFSAFHRGPLSLFAAGKLLGVAGLAWALVRRLRPAEG